MKALAGAQPEPDAKDGDAAASAPAAPAPPSAEPPPSYDGTGRAVMQDLLINHDRIASRARRRASSPHTPRP